MTETYGVWCRVSGGFTGTREAWMKGTDNNIKLFDTLAEAEAEAAKLHAFMNRPNSHNLASFNYRARVYKGW